MKALKGIIFLFILAAVVSLAIGIYSRYTLTPIFITKNNMMEAHTFLNFTNTCLFFAMVFTLTGILNKK